MSSRRAAVAGSWYPGSADVLRSAVDRLAPAVPPEDRPGRLVGLVAPHAGLIYSGPVAAYAYGLLEHRPVQLIVLVGPSHFVPFEGAAVYRRGRFETPLGPAEIDEDAASALIAAAPMVHENEAVHAREHSLEMQLPFVRRFSPDAKIVPVLMGHQTASAARALGEALGTALRGREALLVASTDLSHYHDRATASRLDAVVVDCVARFDEDGLQRALDAMPEHACGGGPTVAVMRGARMLGATNAVVLQYADSGGVSGDTSSVVGYLAAAFYDDDKR